MINVILSGCNGKMGKVISRLAKDDELINIVCGFDINTDSSDGFPVYSNYEDFKEKADVIIDFSHPDNAKKLTDYCKKTGIALVIATTGLSDEQKNAVIDCAKSVPVFFSANMSLGVNLLVNLVKKATEILSDTFDIEIVEKHHNKKIDAPSGTALMLADAANNTCQNAYKYVYDRHSVRQKREKNEIGIHSVRGGTIVGEHSVIFAGTDEIIELKHTAMSKEIFAAGSIKAAKFLAGKGAGLYDMQDLMK